ncbi:hypothetical protein [Geitlerinema sp. PCC 9228]|uniref:hypothetical protein n=1 Tax=Geitlerinema sp. PCC 9228 TaxID=111611 RepID=UPI00147CF49A|nr:hypothetical protein [Geitlerinema sp. PCC 9228]
MNSDSQRSPLSPQETIENNGMTDRDRIPSVPTDATHQAPRCGGWFPRSWQNVWQRSQLVAIAGALLLMLVGFTAAPQLGIWLAWLGVFKQHSPILRFPRTCYSPHSHRCSQLPKRELHGGSGGKC